MISTNAYQPQEGKSLKAAATIREAIRICYSDPLNFIGVGALVGTYDLTTGVIDRLSGNFALTSILLALGGLALHTFMIGALIVMTAHSLGGRKLRWPDAFRWINRRRLFWGLLGVIILFSLLVGVGLLMLVVPGVLFATWYMLALPAKVLGDYRAGDAFNVSRDLVRPVFRDSLYLMLIIAIPSSILLLVSLLTGLVWGFGSMNMARTLSLYICSFVMVTFLDPVVFASLSIWYISRVGGIGNLRPGLFTEPKSRPAGSPHPKPESQPPPVPPPAGH